MGNGTCGPRKSICKGVEVPLTLTLAPYWEWACLGKSLTLLQGLAGTIGIGISQASAGQCSWLVFLGSPQLLGTLEGTGLAELPVPA